MKWQGRRTSTHVEDRRGRGGVGGFGGGGLGRGGVKVGGIGAVILVVAALFFGIDPSMLLGGGGQSGSGPTVATGPNVINDQSEEFVAVVLADTEEVWQQVFAAAGRTYTDPTLVLFSRVVRSACGSATSATGPFYCPGDEKIYLDTDFFQQLSGQLGAGGDFAAAYVIAHEVGHHVQKELGITAQAAGGQSGADSASVRLELQADCFAGVWAQQANARFSSLEPGDIKEALNAASRIGDDTLQRRSQGVVVPDSFTHGTSEQRVRWFQRGFEGGTPDACDTFGAASL